MPRDSRSSGWCIAALLTLALIAWFAWAYYQGKQKRLAEQKAYQEAIEASHRFQDSRRK